MVTPDRPVPLLKAESFNLEVGGAESNVAMYLADLRHPVAWMSRVGDDPLGHRLVDAITARGVKTHSVIFDPARPTGVFFKDPRSDGTRVLYYRRGSAASRMDPTFVNAIDLKCFDVIHLSGITPALSESCRRMMQRLFRLAKDAGTLISFDVNFRPSLWSNYDASSVLLELACEADLVFVGQDEAERLWDRVTPGAVRSLISGPNWLVVKNDHIGATAFEGENRMFVEALQVDVVEPTGAGDAFAAGYLSGMLGANSARDCLRLGHIVAAHALRSTADYSGVVPEDWDGLLELAPEEWPLTWK